MSDAPNEKSVDTVEPVDSQSARLRTFVDIPACTQFTVRQQHRVDSLACAQRLADVRIANYRFKDDDEPQVTADAIVADAEKFFAYLELDD